MNEEELSPSDLEAIHLTVDTQGVHTLFQPVVSVPSKSIVGFEAFSRGAHQLRAQVLFHDGVDPDTKISVDRLCRSKSLEQFKPIHDSHEDVLLFLNVDASILPHVDAGSDYLHRQVMDAGISPERVVIETSFEKALIPQAEPFHAIYKDFGFKFCIDNAMAEFFPTSTLFRLRPEFVKLSRSFFGDAERPEYAQSALDTVLDMARRAGCSLIAQSVETEEESIRLLAAGINMQQGFYYTKDESQSSDDPVKLFFGKIKYTYDLYKKLRRDEVSRVRLCFEHRFRTVGKVVARLEGSSSGMFESALAHMVAEDDALVSAFVANSSGVQVTRRVHGAKRPLRPEGIAASGTDHALRDYVLYLDLGYDRYVSDPGISAVNGEETSIISRPFFNSEGDRYVLCAEMIHPGRPNLGVSDTCPMIDGQGG